MKLTIDGMEKQIDLKGAKTIDEAIPCFKDFIANDRIIVEILADGQQLTEETEAEFLSKEIASVDTVAIKTDSPVELAKTNLKEADEYLDSFSKQIDDVIEVLQVGGEEETYDIFVDGLKGLEDVLYLIGVVKDMLNLESADLKVEEVNFDDYVENIGETLNEFKSALEDEDLVYLQDLLQYEFKPALVTLKSFLALIIAKLS